MPGSAFRGRGHVPFRNRNPVRSVRMITKGLRRGESYYILMGRQSGKYMRVNLRAYSPFLVLQETLKRCYTILYDATLRRPADDCDFALSEFVEWDVSNSFLLDHLVVG